MIIQYSVSYNDPSKELNSDKKGKSTKTQITMLKHLTKTWKTKIRVILETYLLGHQVFQKNTWNRYVTIQCPTFCLSISVYNFLF